MIRKQVAIDTGSDELWVNPECDDETLEPSQRQECEGNGIYRASRSSTSDVRKVIGNATETIQYGIGRVNMTYTTDDIALPNSDIKLTSVQFAVATNTEDLNEGILGLSFGNGTNLVYPNLVDVLFDQGVTNSKAFSVGLGNINADNSGVLIFGGVDTKKFAGELMMNEILGPQFRGDISRYYVELNSIALNKDGNKKTYQNSNATVVLDTGASLSYFPTALLMDIAQDLNGVYSKDAGLYLVDCALMGNKGTIDFAFGGGTIKIPIKDMLLQERNLCALAAGADLEGARIDMLLGDSFLRSVYAVFDQTTNTIGMAPYVNCGTNEQALSTKGAAGLKGECEMPSAAGRPVASYVSVWVGVAVGLLGLVML